VTVKVHGIGGRRVCKLWRAKGARLLVRRKNHRTRISSSLGPGVSVVPPMDKPEVLAVTTLG